MMLDLEKVSDNTLEDINIVMCLLRDRKGEVIQHLFPNSHEGYTKQWWNRNVDHFWGYLDLDNRRRVVLLARKLYGRPESMEAEVIRLVTERRKAIATAEAVEES